jgi:radical SAM protein with 4Fe4S-binding SPASM domain|tara:strand:+ start:32 stop:892 length:861 start_codon:yes stop_codon:yes gene_type:complete
MDHNKEKNRFSPWRSEDTDSIYLNQPFSIPKVIELNTGPTCNRKCSFCPRADGWSEPGDYFEIELANKIAKELSEINFDGLVQFTGYGEPLQHPKIFDLIEVFSRKKIQVELTTNGDFLKRDVAHKLFNSGLAFLRVSLYDRPQQVEKFKKILAGISFEQIKLIERWDSDLFDTKTNRAGYFHGPNGDSIQTNRPCNYPFYHMLINHTGAVYLCPQDWSLKYSLGNVKESSIINIWMSEEYQNYRATLATNRGIKPCSNCDVDGLVYNNQSRLDWISEFSSTLSTK